MFKHLRDSREKLPLTNIRDLFSLNLIFKVSIVMAVGSTGVEERDGRTFGSQRVKMCVSVFATLIISVTVTRTENHQLSCYVTSQDSCIYKVRWLYDGKPYSQPEPRYRCQHTVAMYEDCEEPLQEELFSCEVRRTDSPDDVQLFPLIRQTEGHDATTPTLTTRWPSATGSTGNTGGNSEEPQPGGWWRHLVAVLVVVVVMCILVDFILWERAKGKKKLQEENTVELAVSYTKRGAKVRVQVTDGEDGGEAAPSGGAADESTLYCNVNTLDG
ncbi:uncharacterized protein LOC142891122 isoform X5 [Nelusetta ayraudi]|uniref:uncharacterized protein LOC142891122 isoform X5 n=1 Tax=Nelusetta ayraudi TaxID=303726 RepID=UPI003F6EE612